MGRYCTPQTARSFASAIFCTKMAWGDLFTMLCPSGLLERLLNASSLPMTSSSSFPCFLMTVAPAIADKANSTRITLCNRTCLHLLVVQGDYTGFHPSWVQQEVEILPIFPPSVTDVCLTVSLFCIQVQRWSWLWFSIPLSHRHSLCHIAAEPNMHYLHNMDFLRRSIRVKSCVFTLHNTYFTFRSLTSYFQIQ